MERQRIGSQYYQNKFKPSNKPMVANEKLSYISYSIGKSVKKIDFRQKINSIKQKCLAKSIQPVKIIKPHKLIQKSESKNYSLGDEELDLSYVSSEEETDDAQIQQNNQKITYLKKSRFPGRPHTLFFCYPKYCEIQNKTNKQQYKKIPQVQLKYKIYGSEYKCIINAFQCNGFKKGIGKDWNVFFDVRGSQVKKTSSKIFSHQKFNHFAGCWHLGRKDKLWKCIERQKKILPQEYSFVPKTYIFPSDYERFEMVRQSADKDQLWIQKPVASACGRCIKLIKKETNLKKRKNVLISEYISNPHLINNLKYDLRLYVLVTSFNPLKIYFFDNGLVRFATEQYNKDKKDIKKKFVHLTNFSINKHSKKFIPNNNSQNYQKMSKWSLKALRNYYIQHGINHEKVFADIQDVIIKTCIAAQSDILAPKYRNEDKKSCFFQIYGFDVIIDDKFKPWLLEVNVCPSLCSSSPFDRKIKHTLLTDILNLVGVQYEPIKDMKEMEMSKMSQSLTPSPKKKQKQERRRFRFKNSHNVNNLCYQNCLELLQPEDWLIIFENEEQMGRLGHFKKIFPLSKNIKKYEHHFECPRYSNLILWRYLLSQKNFLHRIGL